MLSYYKADAKTMNVLLAEIRISCNLYEISLILTDMLLRKLPGKWQPYALARLLVYFI